MHGLTRGAVLAGLAAAGTALAAEALDVKLGAWEMTSVGAATGLKIPADVLEGLPPGQRAEMERQLKAQEGKQITHTSNECLTAKDLEEGQILKDEEDEGAKCKVEVISRSPRKLVAEKTCAAPASKTKMTVEAQGREKITGTFSMENADGSRIQMEMKGRWLGKSCEGIEKKD